MKERETFCDFLTPQFEFHIHIDFASLCLTFKMKFTAWHALSLSLSVVYVNKEEFFSIHRTNSKAYLINLITDTIQLSSPPPPAPVAHRQLLNDAQFNSQQQQVKQETDIQAALKDIRTSLQRSKVMNANNSPTPHFNNTNNASNMINNNNYYERTPVIPDNKVESPTMSLSPVWIPR